MKTKLTLIISCILILFALGINTSFGQQCGPGAHWIDNCAGGSDDFQSNATININPQAQCPGVIPMAFQGPTHVVRQAADMVDPGGSTCIAPSGHSGNFHFQTEITNAIMTAPGGFILKIGTANGLQPSIGHVIEDPANNTLGCSFFDVFFEVTIPAGAFGNPAPMMLYNQTPCRMYSVITQAPPLSSTVYQSPQCLPLYPTPMPMPEQHPIAMFSDAHHVVLDTITIPTLSQWGLIIFAGLLLAVGVVFIVRRQKQLAMRQIKF